MLSSNARAVACLFDAGFKPLWIIDNGIWVAEKVSSGRVRRRWIFAMSGLWAAANPWAKKF